MRTSPRSASATACLPARLGLHYGLEQLGAAVVPVLLRQYGKAAHADEGFRHHHPDRHPHLCPVSGRSWRRSWATSSDDFKLRIGLFGSEGCTPEMRAKIEQSSGLFATDNYGMSELIGPGVSGECEYRDGLHYRRGPLPARGASTPKRWSERRRARSGELVVTTLTKEAHAAAALPHQGPHPRSTTTPCTLRPDHTPAWTRSWAAATTCSRSRASTSSPPRSRACSCRCSRSSPHYMLYVRREGYHRHAGGAGGADRRLACSNGIADAGEAHADHPRTSCAACWASTPRSPWCSPRRIERFAGQGQAHRRSARYGLSNPD